MKRAYILSCIKTLCLLSGIFFSLGACPGEMENVDFSLSLKPSVALEEGICYLKTGQVGVFSLDGEKVQKSTRSTLAQESVPVARWHYNKLILKKVGGKGPHIRLRARRRGETELKAWALVGNRLLEKSVIIRVVDKKSRVESNRKRENRTGNKEKGALGP
ncbi:MAG: hypothetical protein MJA29_06485 [Candidatus Omnitrophica bacterium]|nr:hypothetical protein [Candidatus Omnitrophota bacterium]